MRRAQALGGMWPPWQCLTRCACCAGAALCWARACRRRHCPSSPLANQQSSQQTLPPASLPNSIAASTPARRPTPLSPPACLPACPPARPPARLPACLPASPAVHPHLCWGPAVPQPGAQLGCCLVGQRGGSPHVLRLLFHRAGAVHRKGRGRCAGVSGGVGVGVGLVRGCGYGFSCRQRWPLACFVWPAARHSHPRAPLVALPVESACPMGAAVCIAANGPPAPVCLTTCRQPSWNGCGEGESRQSLGHHGSFWQHHIRICLLDDRK